MWRDDPQALGALGVGVAPNRPWPDHPHKKSLSFRLIPDTRIAPMKPTHLLSVLLFPFLAQADPYAGWAHTGTLTILTTPDGANLPAGAAVAEFPVVVRLDRDWFDFREAKPTGEDVRFSTADGHALPYEVEDWDAAKGAASIWVRIPRIEGNARQTIQMHWGKADAASESSGKAVFNEANGYVSVWHLGATVRDEVGTLESKDAGTTLTAGVIGNARHLVGRGISGGEQIVNYPVGGAAQTTEVWFRAERPNGTILAWGNEGGGRGCKVQMRFQSPPHVRVDSDFSDIRSTSRLPMNEWIHVAHTYGVPEGQGAAPKRIYINGQLDGEATTKLDIKSPARLWLGGWYNRYDFVGDLDEARISKVARSAEWVRLEYENQKPRQTLVGPLVPTGDAFAVAPEQATVAEGKSVVFTARAGGAQKVTWSLVPKGPEGRETVLAVDRFAYTFDAGRVNGDTAVTLRLKAVTATGVKTKDIPITIKEDLADPQFTLCAPAKWDGRQTIEVVPQISNLAALQAKGAGEVKTEWSATPLAVTQEIAPGKLVLRRAQNSGPLTVTATMSNGGQPVTQSVTIVVQEPAHDAWVARTPEKEEQPEDGQFFAREDGNEGTLFYCGTLAEPAESVFVRLYADDKLVHTETAKVGADRAYSIPVKLKAGLIHYRTEFGASDKVLHTAKDLVCGDAFLVAGQSNAVSTDWGKEEPPTFHSPWIRTFGNMSSNQKGEHVWGEAGYRTKEGRLQIGYWPMELARQLVETEQVPICIINEAVGGTRIDLHQRNPENPADMKTIYGRMLWRVREARLTHGLRGVFWHQGENDQGADGPTGGFGWETYRAYFLALAASWKQDFPNIQHYEIFQIWPKSCGMGINGSDNRLREVQRTLPAAFAHMHIMSTLGIGPAGGCHYPPAGYVVLSRLFFPLVEQDFYGKKSPTPVTPPNLRRATFATPAKDTITLEFDQPVQWDESLTGQFYLDGIKDRVVSGSVAGNVLTLKLGAPVEPKTITYLDSAAWSQKTLLRGENGIAALTFCEVPLQ